MVDGQRFICGHEVVIHPEAQLAACRINQVRESLAELHLGSCITEGDEGDDIHIVGYAVLLDLNIFREAAIDPLKPF